MGLNACYAEINPYICIWCISLLTIARLADTYYYIYIVQMILDILLLWVY